MTYNEAYKLASWICLNHSRDIEYVSTRFKLASDDVARIIRCVSRDCQQIDIAKLRKLFP